MKYTKIPTNTFQQIQLNAGIIVDSFNPATGEIGSILGATTGGNQFKDTVSFKDFGDDIDNCPKNTKQLKKIDSREATLSGTFVTVDTAMGKRLIAGADIDSDDSTHIIPRDYLLDADFEEIWFIGDYSHVNTGASAGFIAVHVMNALNTSGIQIKSADKSKGQFAYNFTGHYDMEDQDTVPYEIYVAEGEAENIPFVKLNKADTSIVAGSTEALVATTNPAAATVSWSSSDSDVATVSNGTVNAVAAGACVIIAKITQSGVTYIDSCNVTVTAAPQAASQEEG